MVETRLETGNAGRDSTLEGPPRTRMAPVAVDPASRSRWIEAFYVAEAKAELGRQASSNQRRTR